MRFAGTGVAAPVLALLILLGTVPAPAGAPPRPIRTWLCYYGATFGFPVYSKFDLAVFDAYHHPPLKKNTRGVPVMLGYLSVGEVDADGRLWPVARGKSYLVKKNSFWNAWIVDVRDPAWRNLLFTVGLPAVYAEGFDGVFLDTFDSSLHLESAFDDGAFEGTADALVELLAEMQRRYPEKHIAVNRGLPLLSRIAPLIDFVVAEDLYSYYPDHDTGYVRVAPAVREQMLEWIAAGRAANPDLVVLSLDYAGIRQKALAMEAVAFSRSKGFVPYVSTYLLDQVFFYTLPR